MSEALIYDYVGEASEPECLQLDLRDGGIRFVVRGEPVALPGGTFIPGRVAVMNLPLPEAARLTQALLRAPPLAAMIGKVPFVMYFDDASQRDEFVAALRKHQPGLADIDVLEGPREPDG